MMWITKLLRIKSKIKKNLMQILKDQRKSRISKVSQFRTNWVFKICFFVFVLGLTITRIKSSNYSSRASNLEHKVKLSKVRDYLIKQNRWELRKMGLSICMKMDQWVVVSLRRKFAKSVVLGKWPMITIKIKELKLTWMEKYIEVSKIEIKIKGSFRVFNHFSL